MAILLSSSAVGSSHSQFQEHIQSDHLTSCDISFTRQNELQKHIQSDYDKLCTLVKNVISHLITKETCSGIFNLIIKAFGIHVMNVTNVFVYWGEKHMKLHNKHKITCNQLDGKIKI